MQSLFLFFKGLLIGIGKIIPGVSGSLIAVLLHVYEQAITAINHYFENPKKYTKFLVPLGLGVVLSVILFSSILLFLIENYYVIVMFLFLGLILGTVPNFQKEVFIQSFSERMLFLFSFCIPFCIPLFSTSSFYPTNSLTSCLYIILLGFIDATTMIIPGISGTAIFLMLGSYSFILQLFSQPFTHILWTILFGIGLLLGVLLVSRFVEICFTKNHNHFFILILGLLWSSIIFLFTTVLKQITISNFFLAFIMGIIGFFLSKHFS